MSWLLFFSQTNLNTKRQTGQPFSGCPVCLFYGPVLRRAPPPPAQTEAAERARLQIHAMFFDLGCFCVIFEKSLQELDPTLVAWQARRSLY